MITIVDYGMGNLRSVQKAFEKLGVSAEVHSRPEEVGQAEKMVVPGVGAFGDAMQELNRRELTEPIQEHIQAGRPFLGICLGLQLLFEVGYEEGQWPGLGVLSGEVVRFTDRPGLKVPHMGWNQIEIVRPVSLLDGIPDRAYFYFVHSYYVSPAEESLVATRSEHGDRFVSMVACENLWATQFHPEKSQQMGRHLLQNFASV